MLRHYDFKGGGLEVQDLGFEAFLIPPSFGKWLFQGYTRIDRGNIPTPPILTPRGGFFQHYLGCTKAFQCSKVIPISVLFGEMLATIIFLDMLCALSLLVCTHYLVYVSRTISCFGPLVVRYFYLSTHAWLSLQNFFGFYRSMWDRSYNKCLKC